MPTFVAVMIGDESKGPPSLEGWAVIEVGRPGNPFGCFDGEPS
jgi:hypothetical protein